MFERSFRSAAGSTAAAGRLDSHCMWGLDVHQGVLLDGWAKFERTVSRGSKDPIQFRRRSRYFIRTGQLAEVDTRPGQGERLRAGLPLVLGPPTYEHFSY